MQDFSYFDCRESKRVAQGIAGLSLDDTPVIYVLLAKGIKAERNEEDNTLPYLAAHYVKNEYVLPVHSSSECNAGRVWIKSSVTGLSPMEERDINFYVDNDLTMSMDALKEELKHWGIKPLILDKNGNEEKSPSFEETTEAMRECYEKLPWQQAVVAYCF